VALRPAVKNTAEKALFINSVQAPCTTPGTTPVHRSPSLAGRGHLRCWPQKTRPTSSEASLKKKT